MKYIILAIIFIVLAVFIFYAYRKRCFINGEYDNTKILKKEIILIILGIIAVISFIVFALFNLSEILNSKNSVIFQSLNSFDSDLNIFFFTFGMLFSAFNLSFGIAVNNNKIYKKLTVERVKIQNRLDNSGKASERMTESDSPLAYNFILFLKYLAVINLIFFFLGMFNYTDYRKDCIAVGGYGQFVEKVYGYDEINEVDISFGLAPNGYTHILVYNIIFEDGKILKPDLSFPEQMVEIYDKLKIENVTINDQSVTKQQIMYYFSEKNDEYKESVCKLFGY